LQQQIAHQPLRLDRLPTDRRVQLARTRKERVEGCFEQGYQVPIESGSSFARSFGAARFTTREIYLLKWTVA
jgi:hypothetical protein